MASTAIFSSLRRRRSPSLGAFFAPIDLTDLALIRTLNTISHDLISSTFDLLVPFQRRNSRSLIRKVKIFVSLFDFLKDSVFPLPSAATLCFKELYILIYRSKILLDYCSQSSRLWLLLQNSTISGHFHDLNLEISTLLDVFPMKELDLNMDVREQMELLQRQAKRSKLFIDPKDEALRQKLFDFLDEFEHGRRPDSDELKTVFVEELGIRDARSCRSEIEFLEEQIFNQEEDGDTTISVLSGFVALVRYCRFLVFGLEEGPGLDSMNCRKSKKSLICQEIGVTFLTVPKDFCCPISLEMMHDPVIISTGQTYDRSSIARWLEEGHCTCPKTGQMLMHTRLIPNRALRSLIMQWCNAHGFPCDPLEAVDAAVETVVMPTATKAAIEANRATAELLVRELANGTRCVKAHAARELRLLAKTGKENRACIAEAGAIPLLKQLLSSSNPVAQENSVTAILNLSIHDKNKSRIMEEEGCLESVVDVLRHGMTEEARENAAATLFSLSAVHGYKKRITDEEGALEALAGLLREGTPRGKKDAVTALFNLSTHSENCERMVEAGAVAALVGALATEEVAEEAAGALALLVRQGAGSEAVGREDEIVSGLVRLMRWGTPRGKENGVAALLELCRSGGVAVTERVVRVPALAGLLQMLLFTGTKRARRKAASLARVCQRCEAAAMQVEAWGMELPFGDSSTAHQVSNFGSDVSSVSVTVPISVPVL
ncbi:U-box domain-containing protein 17 [Asimina triloba]